jgi:hypothetical protein
VVLINLNRRGTKEVFGGGEKRGISLLRKKMVSKPDQDVHIYKNVEGS